MYELRFSFTPGGMYAGGIRSGVKTFETYKEAAIEANRLHSRGAWDVWINKI